MASYYGNILEEELKNRVAEDWFSAFDASGIIGKIDFSVAKRKDKSQPGIFKETEYYMWAESKQGTSHDIYESFVQLILTIGKARTFDKYLPPLFLGAFDAEKIAFIPYAEVMDVFSQNDFNWNVTPSDHESKEFRQLLEMVKETLTKNSYLYNYNKHEKELKAFIRNNFKFNNTDIVKVGINKNNFTHIYQKWLKEVKDTIATDWDEMKKANITFADFYLADILSRDNNSIKENLSVLLKTDRYRCNVPHEKFTDLFREIGFKDNQKAHTQFWQRYERPPKEEYWDYIVERRDLLVPQDIRERKGSFFTPQKWVELSQEYLAKELGEDWQDEYYIWDCCGGTGNMEAGLTNKYNVWVSTLDMQDVKVMLDLIENKSLHLLPGHVFQFDFLNDPFGKLPDELKKIIDDPEKRKKLIIYINPPYAEATTATTVTGTGENKSGVAINNITNERYKDEIGAASNELFAQFFIRIYHEIPGCTLAEFSKLKILQAQNFKDFRKVFKAKLKSLFIVPADTFDNVKGQFPIGFHIWDTSDKEIFKEITADVYNKNGELVGTKGIYSPMERLSINKWIKKYDNKAEKEIIGYMGNPAPDFQHNSQLYISKKIGIEHFNFFAISVNNLIETCIYLTVRQCIEATWLNDRDQFLYPKDTWKDDYEFQMDCLAYALFHGQNRISAKGGTNHWIPFTEEEVDAKEKFESHFMSDFINGKIKTSKPKEEQLSLFDEVKEEAPQGSKPIQFSPEAKAVMDAGRELWRYYHTKRAANPNAAFYDIRLHFQGVNDKGKMNTGSEDERYTELIKNLRECLKVLGKKIEPKVYEHGFLLK